MENQDAIKKYLPKLKFVLKALGDEGLRLALERASNGTNGEKFPLEAISYLVTTNTEKQLEDSFYIMQQIIKELEDEK